MNTQRENALGWKESFKQDGRWYEVTAEHDMSGGKPNLQWGVTCGGKRICTLEMTPQGDYRSGPLSMQPGISLKQAAERAVKRITLPKAPSP